MDNYFAQNIRFLRKYKGWKQIEIPENTGFSSSAWSNYENGTSYPKFDDLIKICKIFGVTETHLIHSDLSKGNLIKTIKEEKNNKKGNPNSNPSGNLNEPNEAYFTPSLTVNQSLTTAPGLARLISLQQQQAELQAAINAELAAILANIHK